MINIVTNENKLEGTQLDSTSKTLKLANGTEIYLAPGKHHELLIAIIEKFSLRFAPGATALYLGDVLNKAIIYEKERLERLGMSITTQDNLISSSMMKPGTCSFSSRPEYHIYL